MSVNEVLIVCDDVRFLVPTDLLQQHSTKLWNTTHQISEGAGLRIITLENYNGKAVKVLFEWLKGYSELMEGCNDLSIIEAILEFSKTYSIVAGYKVIWQKLSSINISMDHLVQAFTLADKLPQIFNNGQVLESSLKTSWMDVARENLATTEDIIKFLTENKAEADTCAQILKYLNIEPKSTIRFDIPNWSHLKIATLCGSTMIKNLEFSISLDITNGKGEILLDVKHQILPLPKGFVHGVQEQLEIKWTVTIFNDNHHNLLLSWTDKKGGERRSLTFDWQKLEQEGLFKDDRIEVLLELVKSNDSIVETNTGNVMQSGDQVHIETIPCVQRAAKDCNVVLILCQDVKVTTISTDILISYSNVFKALLSDAWNSVASTAPFNTANHNFELVQKIQIESDDPAAVKILLEHLQGYPGLLRDCGDADHLAEILRLVDFYDISIDTKAMVQRLMNIPVSMKNLLDLFEASKKLCLVQDYTEISTALLTKCKEYANDTLQYRQLLLKFVVDNEGRAGGAIQLLQEFRN